MFEIHNKSSMAMKEISSGSIDLAILDPPYNVGSVFGRKINLQSRESYENFLFQVLKEARRTLAPQGKLIFHSPERTYQHGSDCHFPGMITQLAKKTGLFLATFHPFLIKEDASCVPLKKWEKTKEKITAFHSEEHYALIFTEFQCASFVGERLGEYLYQPAEGHPCPSNWEYLKDIMSIYLQPGFNVLEPFMGTGRLGRLVLKQGGNFFGYEIVKEYFQTAKRELELISA